MERDVVIAIIGVYFAPSLIATFTGCKNIASVFIINLFLGWTFIGWVVALAMAFSTDSSHQVFINNGNNDNKSRQKDDNLTKDEK